jgi:hypothetical protein
MRTMGPGTVAAACGTANGDPNKYNEDYDVLYSLLLRAEYAAKDP